MKIALIILAVLFLPVLLDAVVAFALGLRHWRDRRGDADKGLVIFSESIRWMGVRWGFRSVSAGLRQAGFAGEIRYWRWHATWRGGLVLPAIMDSRLLEAQARQLAEFIAHQHHENPGRPIWLIGYSCGAYVAVRALELLPDGVAVEAVALLAAAVDPRRDLTPACRHIRGRMVNVRSWLDWLIVGVGTLVVGTGDRRHTASAGMVGFHAPPPQVVEVHWTPGMIRWGDLGGHFGAASPSLIATRVAPLMGIGDSGETGI